MIRRTAALFCAAGLSMMLAACGTAPSLHKEPAGTTPSLAGKTFVLAGAEGENAPTISFGEDGKISGFAGCNRLLGSAAVDGKKVDFSQLGLTRMMCSPDEMKIEEAFTGSLARAGFATEDDGVLTLWDLQGDKLIELEEKH